MKDHSPKKSRALSPDTSQILWTIAVGTGLLIAVGFQLLGGMNDVDHGEITWIGNPTPNHLEAKISIEASRQPATASADLE